METINDTVEAFLGRVQQAWNNHVRRAEIVRNHHDVFTKWQKGTIPYDRLQTYTLRKDAGRWRCDAFHNTEMSRRSRGAYNPG